MYLILSIQELHIYISVNKKCIKVQKTCFFGFFDFGDFGGSRKKSVFCRFLVFFGIFKKAGKLAIL